MSKCYFAKLNESNDVIEVVVVAGDIPTAAGPLIDNPKHVVRTGLACIPAFVSIVPTAGS